MDPSSKQSFKYDHMRKEASDFEPASVDSTAEPWRAALAEALAGYIKEHFPHGNSAVSRLRALGTFWSHDDSIENDIFFSGYFLNLILTI